MTMVKVYSKVLETWDKCTLKHWYILQLNIMVPNITIDQKDTITNMQNPNVVKIEKPQVYLVSINGTVSHSLGEEGVEGGKR